MDPRFLDLLFQLVETSPAFTDICHLLGGVCPGLRRVAIRTWRRRMHTHNLMVGFRFHCACEGVTLREPFSNTEELHTVINDMMVLEGLSGALFEWTCLQLTPSPITLARVLRVALDGFDLAVIRELSLAVGLHSPVTFDHIAEALVRVGEMRVFVGSAAGPSADPEERMRAASRAYTHYLLHRLRWQALAVQTVQRAEEEEGVVDMDRRTRGKTPS